MSTDREDGPADPLEGRSREAVADRIRAVLAAEGEAVEENTVEHNRRRREAAADFPEGDRLSEEARRIKEAAIDRLPELVEDVERSVEDNGGHVHYAETAAEAREYVADLADGAGVETAVKSKSMTTEEVELNEALRDVGVEVHETDLGEFVLQVAEEDPSHIVGPAIHKSREEIADLFNDAFDPEEPLETAEELTAFAREYLGDRIREADLGVTGANFVLADSGSIVLVTNEGNARKTAVTPDTHIAVAGVEKLLPSADDLEPFVRLIARAATGQPISQYVSVFTPPVDSPTLRVGDDAADDPAFGDADDREFHLVLLDNGRTELREDEALRETLYCIRCGACSNACANFQQVGGHVFGGETYSGGIAGGWEAGVHGQSSAEEFVDLCTGCTRCVDACPVNIDVPWINTVIKDRRNRGTDPGRYDFLVDGLLPDAEGGDGERAGLAPSQRLFANVDRLAKWGSRTAPVSNRLARSRVGSYLAERLFGVDRRAELPAFARETFSEWYADRGPRVGDPDRVTTLYPDIYTEYVDPDRGRAAVRTLEALGCEVRLADAGESGRAPLSQGMVATARDRAEAVAADLSDHVAEGRRVVALEPSDLSVIRREYERLLDADTYATVAGETYGFCEYLYGLVENGADPGPLTDGRGRSVVFHAHCQGEAVDQGQYVEAVLDRLGYDVTATEAECCGMAGSFGYKEEYYDLSAAVGDSLAADLERQGVDVDRRGGPAVVAAGTSCLTRIDELLADRPLHPAELLAP